MIIKTHHYIHAQSILPARRLIILLILNLRIAIRKYLLIQTLAPLLLLLILLQKILVMIQQNLFINNICITTPLPFSC